MFYGKDAFEGLHVMDRLGAIRRGDEPDDPDWGVVPSESKVPAPAYTKAAEEAAERGDTAVELPARSPEVAADNALFAPAVRRLARW